MSELSGIHIDLRYRFHWLSRQESYSALSILFHMPYTSLGTTHYNLHQWPMTTTECSAEV